jgi:hypothetical protein
MHLHIIRNREFTSDWFVDIVERFQLIIFVSIIAARNTIELIGLPNINEENLFQIAIPWDYLFTSLSFQLLLLVASELLVDWLKHAFITKFNLIKPSIYQRFVDILCRDLAGLYNKVYLDILFALALRVQM